MALLVESPPVERPPVSLAPATASMLQNEAYMAAREGRVRRLKRIWLDACARQSELDPRSIFAARHPRFRHSPLIAACKHNHLPAAQFLLRTCGVSIECTGDVQFSEAESVVIQAAPLWTAASAGHTKIVRFLIAEGADINHATKTGSTPVRGACYDGFLDVVQALVKNGADINKPNDCGQTPLMVAIGRGHSKVANFLLESKANVEMASRDGFTAVHICAASERGNCSGLRSLYNAGAKLNRTPDGWSVIRLAAATGNESMVTWLRQHDASDMQEVIVSLEVLGATMLDKRNSPDQAMLYWTEALRLRVKHNMRLSESDVIPASRTFEMRTEALTEDDFDRLESDQSWMDMHSLLVRERVLGQSRPTAYYIRRRGMRYLASQRFDRCCELWLHALEMHKNVFRNGDREILQVLHNCVFVFRDMTGSGYKPPVEPFLRWVLAEAKTGAFTEAVDRSSLYQFGLHLLLLWEAQAAEGDAGEYDTVVEVARSLVKCAWQQSVSLLHLAVNVRTQFAVGNMPLIVDLGGLDCPHFPSASLARLLLRCGVPPDVFGDEHRTPLQTLFACAVRAPFPAVDDVLETAKVLLDGGAHLDAHGPTGHCTFHLVETRADNHNHFKTYLNFLKLQQSRHISLKCLAARSVVVNRLPFRNVVPNDVIAFIELH